LEIEIKDDNFDLTYLLITQNTLFKLIIKLPTGELISNNWIVKNYETLENTPNFIVYRVFCDLANPALALNSYCFYATASELTDGTHNDEIYFEKANDIIYNILINDSYNGIRFNYSEYIKNNCDLPASAPVQFITSHNMTKLNAIKYLLSVGVGINTGSIYSPTYLIYNIIKNEGFLVNRYQLFKDKFIDDYNPGSIKTPLMIGNPNGRITCTS